MTDDPEDVISESTTVTFPTPFGGGRDLKFPLSQYSDEELLDMATELVERKPSPGDSHNLVWRMAFVCLEMNRRVYQERIIDGE